MSIGLKDAVEAMEYDELMGIKIDLESGGFNIKKMITQKIREKEKKHEKKCAVCSSDIDSCRSSNYTLIFGPEDFKKKATFCGMDCLEYFIAKMRDMSYRKMESVPQKKEKIE